MDSPPKNYANKPWPPRKVAAYLPCDCIAGGAPPRRRCTGNWTRCNKRLGAIREWQDKQPDKAPATPISHPLRTCRRGDGRDIGTGGRAVIAALFVERGGVYWDVPGIDPWDEARDARLYAGPWPVVAHPPCSRWCQLAYINQKRYGHKVGDDGGCFRAALGTVRQRGGVLEHPAFSYAWPAHGLPKPRHRAWLRELWRPAPGLFGWVTQVSQGAYGHAARKLTWLYYVGAAPPPPLDWSTPAPTAQVSFCKNHGDSPLPRLSKKEAKRTPLPFRDLLLSIAATATPHPPTAVQPDKAKDGG